MDDPFSCKQKGDGYLSLPRGWNSNLEYSISDASELMNFDAYAGWCNSPSNLPDQSFPSFALYPLSATSASFSPFDGNNFTDQYSSGVPLPDDDIVGSSPLSRDKAVCDAVELIEMKDNSSSTNNIEGEVVCSSGIPRYPMETLSEKMLRALHLFKESSGGGILAQVWVPMMKGDQYILSTCEQPYLLDKTLSGYREVSRTFTFSAESKPGSFPGLPGRVFNSKVPEWTSNVRYYNKAEYLRVHYALDHEVRGSIALPVFEDDSTKCCAVLELVTVKEKSNFNMEMENLCCALQAVKLRSTSPPRLNLQTLSQYQKAALAEITDVLRAICHAHRLPLALTWIPCSYVEGSCGEVHNTPNEKSVLCIENSACYVNDKNTLGFVHTCGEYYLEFGQGIVGKALQSNHPFFYGDVKEYHISEYPLAHHARRFGLNAAVAIRLRSTYTGDNDYILELFLPVDMKGSNEQQLLLNSLSSTMQRICKSLRTVSDAELLETEYSKLKYRLKDMEVKNLRPVALSFDSVMQNGSESRSEEMETYGHDEKTWAGPRKHVEKKRSTTEKHVSLSVIQQYFTGSLKDAAKSIGVCPTTLKRICRQHGILRWPSRKINKVNRSLMRIQSVLDSVHGVEAGLQFNPIVGGRIPPSSFIHGVDSKSLSLSPNRTNLVIQSSNSAPLSTTCVEVGSTVVKTEKECVVDGTHFAGVISKSSSPMVATRDEIETNSKNDTWMDRDDGVVEHNQPTSSVMTNSSNGSGSGSGSLMKGISSSSRSFGENGSKITVKATYKEDMIRFKYDPGAGCLQVYEEISRRFKLQIGHFQLKYLDDEAEWVLLVSDSDLNECLDVMELLGKRNVKLLVCDVPISVGSSGSSNCFMGGGSL